MNALPEPRQAVSIIIVNYNAGSALTRCVESVLHDAQDVIVVDNASHDNSLALLEAAFPSASNLKIIRSEKNLGFGKACNLGATEAAAPFILFLNPDSVAESGAIAALLTAMEDNDVGMAGGLLLNPDGTEQPGGRRGVPTPWRSLVRVTGLSRLADRYPRLFSDFLLHQEPLPKHPIPVEAISGACMMVKRTEADKIGLFDENYFLHCEDLDLCVRFRRAGQHILFVPAARIFHEKGLCSRSRPIFVEWHKHKGMVRFYQKFFRHQYPGLLMALVVSGVWLRFIALSAYKTARQMMPVKSGC